MLRASIVIAAAAVASSLRLRVHPSLPSLRCPAPLLCDAAAVSTDIYGRPIGSDACRDIYGRSSADEDKACTQAEPVVKVYTVHSSQHPAMPWANKAQEESTGSGFSIRHDGQLCIGRTSPSFVPRYLSALQGTPIAMIASGAAHCAALSVYGRVFTWGEALCGQLGLGTPLRSQASPCEVPDLPDLQAIACGEFHTVVLSAEGSVYSWGLSTRGPPTSRKMTPKPELLTTLTEPITSLSCGGGSTLLIGESGDVLCWPGAGREMGVVPLAPGLKASRTACAGVGALIFVETSITHITPSCAPLAGGSLMELHGAGFYESDGIVLRLTHASGQQKLVRGKLGTDRNGGLIVTAEAPSFSESGPGDVSVAVSFEEGEGEISYEELAKRLRVPRGHICKQLAAGAKETANPRTSSRLRRSTATLVAAPRANANIWVCSQVGGDHPRVVRVSLVVWAQVQVKPLARAGTIGVASTRATELPSGHA